MTEKIKYIYTGYKWRPMTGLELEIMNPEKIVPVKPEEPTAGDIWEGLAE